MSVHTKAAPEITRAAERYLEQYGDPLVMNTYLKITISSVWCWQRSRSKARKRSPPSIP